MDAGQPPLLWVNTKDDSTRLKKDDAVAEGKRQACQAVISSEGECKNMVSSPTALNGPYDVMLLNAGADVFRFVDCTAPNEPQLLRQLPSEPWLSHVPDFLRRLVSCEAAPDPPKLFALPVGVHRLNQLYINQERLQSTALAWPPSTSTGLTASSSTLEQFLKLLGDLQERGCAHPIAIEGDAVWPWSLLLVENIMVGIAGADIYEQFWKQLPTRGGDTVDLGTIPTDVRDATLRAVNEGFTALNQAIDFALQLAPYVQEVSPSPMARVQQPGLCADGLPIFTVMGDWEVQNVNSDIVQAVPFPGTEGTYVYTADAFAVPQANTPAAQADNTATLWFKVVSDPLIQLRYARLKGSLPLVTEQGTVPTERELFGDQRAVPGLPGFVPNETFNSFQSEVEALMKAALSQAQTATWDATALVEQRKQLVEYTQDEYCKTTGFCRRETDSTRIIAGCTARFSAAPDVIPAHCLPTDKDSTLPKLIK